jgi:hypothetical protein
MLGDAVGGTVQGLVDQFAILQSECGGKHLMPRRLGRLAHCRCKKIRVLHPSFSLLSAACASISYRPPKWRLSVQPTGCAPR